MGSQSKDSRVSDQALRKWRNLARKPKLSPEFAGQIRRNIREMSAREKPIQAPKSYTPPPPAADPFFKKVFQAITRPFARKPSNYKGVN